MNEIKFSQEYLDTNNQNEQNTVNFLMQQLEKSKSLLNQNYLANARELGIDGRMIAMMRKVNSETDLLLLSEIVEYPHEELMEHVDSVKHEKFKAQNKQGLSLMAAALADIDTSNIKETA